MSLPINDNPMTTKQARELNPLVLAYVGDGVHTLYVRLRELCKTTGKADKLHKAVTSKVKAEAQAKSMLAIADILSEEENDIFHRARNSHTHSMAKNATVNDYRIATGFEALIGYLYLTGQRERLELLLDCSYVVNA
ncbi:MAG: Mini-ribonuclease 3 [Clostridia bacterium]|nr:Mini-ribonuclease 3 [Clostridia bacterium]